MTKKGLLNEFFTQSTSAMWNGMKVEFGKIYSNPALNAFKPVEEAVNKKLRVFDFDDTLVQTKSHIYVTHKNGKKSTLTPGEYAVYVEKPGDEFDFSDFQSVKQPQEIKGVTRLLKNIVRVGGADIVILTARAAYKPVKDYLNDIGLNNIFVVALGDADPQKKADWIESKIKDGVNDVYFIDDSHKNIQAVKGLEKKYPNISLKVRHVQHDIPKAPKQVRENVSMLKRLVPKYK